MEKKVNENMPFNVTHDLEVFCIHVMIEMLFPGTELISAAEVNEFIDATDIFVEEITIRSITSPWM